MCEITLVLLNCLSKSIHLIGFHNIENMNIQTLDNTEVFFITDKEKSIFPTEKDVKKINLIHQNDVSFFENKL